MSITGWSRKGSSPERIPVTAWRGEDFLDCGWLFGLSIILIFFIELGYPNKSEFHDDFSKVGEYESSEPTSLATTSTMEGEHTLSPGAGEDGGEGLGEVSFHGTPLSVLWSQSSTLRALLSKHVKIKMPPKATDKVLETEEPHISFPLAPPAPHSLGGGRVHHRNRHEPWQWQCTHSHSKYCTGKPGSVNMEYASLHPKHWPKKSIFVKAQTVDWCTILYPRIWMRISSHSLGFLRNCRLVGIWAAWQSPRSPDRSLFWLILHVGTVAHTHKTKYRSFQSKKGCCWPWKNWREN